VKIRRAVATAVACAVATPVPLLCAAPAFANPGSFVAASRVATAAAASIAELERAVVQTKKAYDAAVTAEAEYQKVLDAKLDDTTHPLAVAATTARAQAEKTAATKTSADKAATDAKAAVEAIVEDPNATEDQRVAAFKALNDAQKTAEAAATAKTAADARSTAAQTALSDYRVQLVQRLSVLKGATKEALTALQAAEKALDDARKAGSGGTGGTPAPSPGTPGTGGTGATPAAPGAPTPAMSGPSTSGSTPQSGAGPATAGASHGDSDGSLSETGSSSALPRFALAGAAAVALGAGAVFVVRRRRTAGRTSA
jgi:colicin import membrane protein